MQALTECINRLERHGPRTQETNLFKFVSAWAQQCKSNTEDHFTDTLRALQDGDLD